MKGALKIGLLGVGGFLLYNWARAQGWGSAIALPGGTPATPNVSATPPPTTMQLMAARAAQDPIWQPTMSPHEWNFLYQLIRGGVPPAPPAGIADRLTMAEWYAAMQPLGVSGVGYTRWRR
jgi:hypothetical protein